MQNPEFAAHPAFGWGRFFEAVSFREAGIKDGDLVSAVVQSPTIAASKRAFALFVRGGVGAVGGRSDAGGDASRGRGTLAGRWIRVEGVESKY